MEKRICQGHNNNENISGCKIVGVIDNSSEGNKSKLKSTVVCSDGIYSELTEGTDKIYGFAVGSMPKEKARCSRLFPIATERIPACAMPYKTPLPLSLIQ